MTINLNDTGLQIDDFNTIFEVLVEGYKNIYGDINLNPNASDGQRVGLESKGFADLQQGTLDIYNQLDPDFASGENLRKILKLSGLTPKPATKSTVLLKITTDRTLILQAGYKVADEAGNIWQTIGENTLTSGDNEVTFEAEEWGQIEALANTINTPIDVVLGVISINNENPAVIGQAEETEKELRIRRNKSFENPSSSTIGALWAKLSALKGVTDLMIYENFNYYTITAPIHLTPHTIWIIIEGGTFSQIVETIVKQTYGVNLQGGAIGYYTEELKRPDGSTYSYVHQARFDLPDYTDLYIKLNVKRKIATEAININLIKEKLLNKKFNIAEDVGASELYQVVYEAGNNFIASDLQLSADGGVSWTQENIEMEGKQKLMLESANITITEIF